MSRAICPHCDTTAKVYATKPQTKLVRDIYYACENVECRHTFLTRCEVIQTICPSMNPARDVVLPLSARFRASAPAAPPTPANDSAIEDLAEA
ncbi:ogr/Delta-like zinc finger family protein [Caulobacter segnis]|uniref:Zinc finger Ogr/Delta-type domain-containing protein n=1 Tax=Caulobacter segnis TaxID=88688 RepID=A0A2W5VD57_9CAUL|nr:ogr/Delta-like zinc finger family protein [Caulobacter segnis]PZR37192.1 MAG: hypothetical protein DI526_01360 [Caulobacter segnis]